MQEIYEINNLHILQEKIDVANTGHITNCYIVFDSDNEAVVIDPAFDAKRIIQVLNSKELNLRAIFLTHCHADHTGALKDLLDEFNVDVYGHNQDLENINNESINCKDIVGVDLKTLDTTKFMHLIGGEKVVIGNMEFYIISTPRPYKRKYCFL